MSFSFQNITIVTPFDYNILYGNVTTKLKDVDMGSKDWFVLARNLTVLILPKIATAIGLGSHSLTMSVLANMIMNKVCGLCNNLAKGRLTVQAGGNTDGDINKIIVIDDKANAVTFNAP